MCKIAHMREDAEESSRPNRGRPRKDPNPTVPADISSETEAKPSEINNPNNDGKSQPVEQTAKIQTSKNELQRRARSTRNPNPSYVAALRLQGRWSVCSGSEDLGQLSKPTALQLQSYA